MKCVLDIKTGKAEPWAALQIAAYSAALYIHQSVREEIVFEPKSHVYYYDGKPLPSVTTILKAEGFIDTSFYDDYSRERGSLVHLATQLYDTEVLDEESIDPVIVPYLDAWKKFRKETGFIIEQIETPVFNPAYGYAGTPDRIGQFPGTVTLTRCALELHNDGKYKLITFTDRNDQSVFYAACAVYHWKNNNLKRR